MRFGIVIPAALEEPWGTGWAGEGYERTIEAAILAEELGFDFVVFGSHRFSPGFPSAPFAVLSAIAARTSRIRLGTNILILPAYHPLDVAEQVTTLDQLSRGRAFVGAGVGYRAYEFDPVGAPFAQRGERMEEALEVLGAVLSREDVTHRGTHWAFENVTVHPRPVQRPRPPLVVGAQRRRAVERAARLADGWTTDSKQTLTALLPLIAHFRAIAQAHGRAPTVCVARDVAIRTDRAELERDWLPGVQRTFRYYGGAGMSWNGDAVAERVAGGEDVGFDEFVEGRFIAGLPDDCIRQIQEWQQATGCDQFLVRLGYGRDWDEAAVRLFGEHIIPAFAGAEARRV